MAACGLPLGNHALAMKFLHHLQLLCVVGACSLPVYVALAKIFWGEKFETLGETVKYLFLPNWLSFLRGRYWDDVNATFDFYLYLALCFGWAAGVTELIARHLL